MILWLPLHLLAAIVWVGGMFFAHMILRPAALPLEPQVRLPLWSRVFSRFFPWVWLSIAALFASGVLLVMLGFGGFTAVRGYIRAMMTLGVLMLLIFTYIYIVPWPDFRKAVAASDWPAAAGHLAQIRRLVTVNLVLGLATAIIAAGGRYLD